MIGIVGGGLSGLLVAKNLAKKGKRSIVFEASEKVGGLLRSDNIEGFTFDVGGSHIVFSKNKDVLKEMLRYLRDYVEHRRRTYIFYKNKFIKYPFENGFFSLPPAERYEILLDFVKNLTKQKSEPKNLLDWFKYVFGDAITEKYLRPYNEKLWRRDLREISIDWIERIPNPPIEDVLKSAVGIETEGYTHQLQFFYPLHGGIEVLARNVAEGLDVRLSEPVESIKVEENLRVKANDSYTFEKIVYTAPLKILPNILKEAREIKENINSLQCNSLAVIGIGIKGKLPNFHWIYVPQEDIPFHRVAFLSNYSPKMAPKGYSSIIAEVSNPEKIREDEIVEGLRKMGFDVSVEVFNVWCWDYAYIVYDHAHKENIETVKKFLLHRNIIPFGRFGAWEYLNMDAIFLKAAKLAETL